jgi:hypothetical protein
MPFHNKLFQPSLMFAGKARAYPREAPFRCSTLGRLLALSTNIRLARLKKLARDKHSSLLQKSVNYGRKIFYSTGPSLV